MFLETPKDLLYLVLAFCVLWFTVFLCWGMWYFIVTLRSMAQITTSAKKKMQTIDKILELVKDKLEKGSNHIGLIADSAIKLVGLLMDKQKSKTGSGKKKAK